MKKSLVRVILAICTGWAFWSPWVAQAASGACMSDFEFQSPSMTDVQVSDDSTEAGVLLSQSTSGVAVVDSCGGGSSGFMDLLRAHSSLVDSKQTWTNDGVRYPVYQSGIDGIGMALGFKSVYGTSFSINRSGEWIVGHGDDPTVQGEFIVWYVSTGPIKSGMYSLPRRVVATSTRTRDSGTDYGYAYIYLGAGEFSYSGLGCELIDSQVNVKLGQVSASKYLKGTGSVSPATFFPIPLRCSGQVAIDMTVSSSGAIDVNKGLLKVAAGGATGVAIQLLKGDGVTPFPLGKELRVVDQTVEGLNNIGLAARYYQNASKVVVGKAVGTAQFTLKYR